MFIDGNNISDLMFRVVHLFTHFSKIIDKVISTVLLIKRMRKIISRYKKNGQSLSSFALSTIRLLLIVLLTFSVCCDAVDCLQERRQNKNRYENTTHISN